MTLGAARPMSYPEDTEFLALIAEVLSCFGSSHFAGSSCYASSGTINIISDDDAYNNKHLQGLCAKPFRKRLGLGNVRIEETT